MAATKLWGCNGRNTTSVWQMPRAPADKEFIMSRAVPGGLIAGLRSLVGVAQVADDANTLDEHAGDKWFARRRPDAVVFARSASDVSRVLKFAAREGVPVTTRGAGVGYVGGAVPARGGIALSLARMNRILDICPQDGVAVVEPGVITGDLQDAVRAVGWFYPPDPASLRECSIGGNIATNAGGPRCLKYGVTRNYVLGLEVVLPNGDVVQAGGRTHKNKTGFDLVGLFTGSEGLLGVVTGATLRIIPHPPARAALSAGFRSMRRAAAAVQGILDAGFLPSALEIADAFTLEAARHHFGKGLVPKGNAHLLVEIDGHEDSVRSELRLIESLVQSFKALDPRVAFGDAACEEIWQLRRDFSYSLKATGLVKLNEDVVVPRGRLVDLIDFAAELQRQHGYPVACFGHAGDGNIHVNIMAADYHEDPAVRRKVRVALDALFRQIIQWGGSITGEHGVGLAKMPWWRQAVPPTTRRLHATLKQALDPGGILNPGKFV